jgi:cytochrome c oxidase subunit II
MEPNEFANWLAGGTGGSMREQGEKLFQQYGCVTCHVTNSQGRCPSLLNVFGKPVVLDDGRTVLADEAYVRESILNPNAKIVKGYQPNIMPVFEGQIGEDGLLQLIAYIKSLSPATPNAAKPAVPAATRSSK